MASPAVATKTGGNNDTLQSSHTVNLPASIAAGDTLLVFFGHKDAAGATPGFPGGWTVLGEIEQAGGSLACLCPAWRKADGTEGATITVTTTNTTRQAHSSLRITGAADPTVTAPTTQAGVAATNTNAPNPPNCNPAVSKDYLFIAAFVSSAGRITSADPANYTHSSQTNGSNSGTTTHAGVGVATRQLTAASDDPAAFTTTGGSTEEVASQTIAIHPAGAAAATSLLWTPPPTRYLPLGGGF